MHEQYALTPGMAALQFYAMVNFCNPGVLGAPKAFHKTYESPILAGQAPLCALVPAEPHECHQGIQLT